MKERPIRFKPEMVKAILDGDKTQTRRIVAHQPQANTVRGFKYSEHLWGWHVQNDAMRNLPDGDQLKGGVLVYAGVKCPYGNPGDRLWVKEAWQWLCDDPTIPPYRTPKHDFITWRATYHQTPDDPIKWKSSLFMPRWASRLTLEVTDVRLERLHRIDGDGAYAEGIFRPRLVTEATDSVAVRQYRCLWEKIHGPRAWDDNPWVWVVTFQRLESDTLSNVGGAFDAQAGGQ